jgi:hypothetical protein
MTTSWAPGWRKPCALLAAITLLLPLGCTSKPGVQVNISVNCPQLVAEAVIVLGAAALLTAAVTSDGLELAGYEVDDPDILADLNNAAGNLTQLEQIAATYIC